ncbi:ATP-binding protein [Erythrobacter sp.]|uniref:ATP-binding protein n=1 Tax=Erythrobacter sp. TaxID=1042 RepID=UPI001425D11D|nr:ATP-binding protein [Erythrobacter sp.]QIQ85681.1 MAG: ATP-binding protein [Erythrobacter sp.]
MRALIDIGRDSGGQALSVDLEELLATRLLVQGNSGSGKSHLLRRLLEECAGEVQQVVIDPEGDFVSLGDEFGHVVIDGADYSPREIEALAARVRQHRASVVLALDELEVEQQIRCAAMFLTALFNAPREHWYPALVVVDEAQMFAPSAAGEMSDETRRMTLSAMTNLMCRGRKRGLAGIVATQRLAKMAKNVAAEASNFLMGRTFLDIDMQRAADLLGMDRRQAERIRDLQRGQFLGLGPAISRRPVAVTIGPVRTAGKNAAAALIPLPEAPTEEMEALLNADLADAAAATVSGREAAAPGRAQRPAREIESALAAATLAKRAGGEDDRVQAEAAPQADNPPLADEENPPVPPPADPGGIEGVVREMAQDADAPFRSASALFRDFAVRCRQRSIPSAHVDLPRFRRLFAAEIAGLSRLDGALREAVEDRVEGVEEDVLAPYLALVVAAATGAPMPGEDELARLYGSSSPSRVRRLLDHLERSGLIVVKEDFGGDRSILLPGMDELTASAETA